MGFFDKFVEQDENSDTGRSILSGKFVIKTIDGAEMLPPDSFPNFPLSKTGAPYAYIKRESGIAKEYETEEEAKAELNTRFSNSAPNAHDDLFMPFLPTEYTVSKDIYYFRCISCDSVVILTCQTKDQEVAAKYWDNALDEYSKDSTVLIYSLLDLFLHLGTITIMQILKDPLFRSMVDKVHEPTNTNKLEVEFLDKKINQVDPGFFVKD